MHLLADANLPQFADLVARLQTQLTQPITLQTYSERQPSTAQLAQADALFIRSVTKVDAALIAQAPRLKWLGTATIGMDHVDQAAVAAAGIIFHSTPGVNAQAVGDYVACAVAQVNLTQQRPPQGRAAIIGAGHTGRAAGQRLQGLGYAVHYYDPPLLESGKAAVAVHADWQQVLTSQVISCHVPLTSEGPYKTRHLWQYADLSQLAPDTVFVNASRGPVVAEVDLLRCLQQRQALSVVLDVWEHEPNLNPELLALVKIATPHIAGHSLAGKLGGSLQLLQKWLADQQLNARLPSLPELLASSAAGRTLQVDSAQAPDWQQLARWLLQVYDIAADDALLRAAPTTASAFDQLRRNYAARAELSQLQVATANWLDATWQTRFSQLTVQTAR